MSILIGGPRPSGPVPYRLRLLALPVVGTARIMATFTPKRLRRVLESARQKARPATLAEAQRALDAVLTVSSRCRGEYCLQRAIATALLCRATGTWPEWRVGVRTQPFQAHAWVIAEGTAVGENSASIRYFTPIMTVPPVPLAGYRKPQIRAGGDG